MQRFVILFLAGVIAATATTMTSVSCALGSKSQSNSDPMASACQFPGSIPLMANANASVTVSPYLESLSLSAGGSAGLYVPARTPYQVTAEASASDRFDTSGPVRHGLVTFDIVITNEHGGFATASLSDGTNQYSLQSFPGGCQLHVCTSAETMPIMLGTPLNLSGDANTFLSGDYRFGANAFGDGNVMMTFSLFEANGVTPVATFLIPEPTSVELLLAGALIFSVLLWRRRMT